MACRLKKAFLSVPFRMQRSGAAPPISASLNEREVLFVFAVIETGGKQYKVSEGDIVFIEKLSNEEGSEVVFENVKALSAEDGLKVGTPVVAGARVTANVLKNGKGPKIYVFKYKSKKNEKKKIGHRQPYTKVQITKIEG
ncbi:50S ribosomal protein L21 [Anaerotruncus sp. CAG:390]|nr:50S ribosomal protein L21 [Anaerotruncus sp. CAG:390]